MHIIYRVLNTLKSAQWIRMPIAQTCILFGAPYVYARGIFRALIVWILSEHRKKATKKLFKKNRELNWHNSMRTKWFVLWCVMCVCECECDVQKEKPWNMERRNKKKHNKTKQRVRFGYFSLPFLCCSFDWELHSKRRKKCAHKAQFWMEPEQYSQIHTERGKICTCEKFASEKFSVLTWQVGLF